MTDAASRVLAAIGDDFGDEAPPPNSQGTTARSRPQASQLVDLALDRYWLGRATSGEPFAVPFDGPYVARMLRGGRDSLRAELAAIYAERHDRAPSAAALADALLVLEGRAQREPASAAALRVARFGASLVLDLGAEDGAAVVVGSSGWSVHERSPVLFRRSELTAPLPRPEGGDLGMLRQFVNVTDEAWPLVVAWLVAALDPDMPHPILLETGEQGVGKSTSARNLVEVVDPSPAPLRASPKDPEQWAVTAAGSWLVGIDNVSTIPPWLSDALCRSVTGDGLVRRRLYTDSEITVLAIRRVLVLTSIDPGALRGDLADRLLPVELERLDPSVRRTEDDLARAFSLARPAILGGLLDLAGEVLARLPGITLARSPRMADFARVLAAVDAVLGTSGLATYEGLGSRLAADIVESDVVASAVCRFVEKHGGQPWTGTATELFYLLDPDPKPRGWPADGTRLSGRLRRAAPALRSVGVEVEHQRQGSSRRRLLTVRRADASADARGLFDPPQRPREPLEGAGQVVDADARTVKDAEIPSPLCPGQGQEREIEGDGKTASAASAASASPWLDWS